jgi:hypothetical protein
LRSSRRSQPPRYAQPHTMPRLPSSRSQTEMAMLSR